MVKRVLVGCVDLVAGLREAESAAVGGAETAGGEVPSAGDAEFSSW